MVEVIGVRFRPNGKIYHFNPLNFKVRKGDHVIVETARGVEYGEVVTGRKAVSEEKVIAELKPVIRVATAADTEKNGRNKEKAKEALKICAEKVKKHGLDMKLVDAEYTFDGNKALFYFTSDGRVDFRELVKDLASVFKTRIELRQIGVRDETKLCGGVGMCGRELCCHTFLSEFNPVSIKMAKEQNLSLNPTKISGTCGRLMCCLKNEQESYEYLNRSMPGVNDEVTTKDGQKGKVLSVNVLRQLVKVVFEDEQGEKEVVEFRADELKFRRSRKKVQVSAKEKKELESLEKEGESTLE